MRRHHNLRLLPALTAIAAVATALSGCAVDECLDNQNSLPTAGFYTTRAPGEQPVAITLSGLTIKGFDAPGDSALLDNSSASEVFLPFRLGESSTMFDLTYNLGEGMTASDQIEFSYTTRPYFASAACGAIYKYEIDGIHWTTNYIDSVTCPTGIIDNTPGQNIRIYFKTAQEEPAQ